MSCLSCNEPVTCRFSFFCIFKKNINFDLTYDSRFQNNDVIINYRPRFLIRSALNVQIEERIKTLDSRRWIYIYKHPFTISTLSSQSSTVLFRHFCQFFLILGNPRYCMKTFEFLIFFFILGSKQYSLDNSWMLFITLLIVRIHTCNKHQSLQKSEKAYSLHPLLRANPHTYTCT